MNRLHRISHPGRRKNTPAKPLAVLAFGAACVLTTTAAPKISVVSQWGRFEAAFHSSVSYPNPFRDAEMSAVLVSPTGETNRVDGFWDGGKTWRVRFSPNTPGRWTLVTSCSDEANRGLHRQAGEFICTAISDRTALARRGPLRVARDGRHFEHADGTRFLWLGDVAWEGARRSEPGDWQLYADVRARQKFTVAQWSVAPGPDTRGEAAFTTSGGFVLNVKFFQRLDSKVDALNRAGLVSAILPLQEFGGPTEGLDADEAARFLRYVAARWGAHQVVWLLAFEGDPGGKAQERWKQAGRAAFGDRARAPVILLPGETHWVLDEFRNETWVDAFGFPATTSADDSLQWMFSGPLSVEWQKPPPRPIFNATPSPELSVEGADARRLLWWNLLTSPTVGTSYAVPPVMNWVTNATPDPNVRPRDLPQWREALFRPGVHNVAKAAEFFRTLEFWRLRPSSELVREQPGLTSPRRHIAAARSETGGLGVVYIPAGPGVEFSLELLKESPVVVWVHPVTGELTRAVGLVTEETVRFPTPDANDWLLLLKPKP